LHFRQKPEAEERQHTQKYWSLFELDQRFHHLSFLSPRGYSCRVPGPEEAGGPERGKVLRLIQIRLTTASFDKNRVHRQHNSLEAQIIPAHKVSVTDSDRDRIL
jgi:hypothetical protein